ncbi:hypothetical protein ABZ568_38825 [Streptomyces olindensis]|uniref:Uncharacterized protein n=1 Tax=Streptomyces olindensis TaxID=358823 RepID=A0ABV2Y7Q7_9ACTN
MGGVTEDGAAGPRPTLDEGGAEGAVGGAVLSPAALTPGTPRALRGLT